MAARTMGLAQLVMLGAAFLDHVPHVLVVIAEEQVTYVDTRPVVALVQHEQTFGYGAD